MHLVRKSLLWLLTTAFLGTAASSQQSASYLGALLNTAQAALDSGQTIRSLALCDSVLVLARHSKLEDELLQSRGHHLRALALLELKRYQESAAAVRRALPFSQEDADRMARLYKLQADLYGMTARVDSMGHFFRRGIDWASRLDDALGTQLKAEIYNNAAGTYLSHRLIDTARMYADLARVEYQALGDSTSNGFAKLLSHHGLLSYYGGQYQAAIDDFKRSTELRAKIHGPTFADLAPVIMNIGIMYYILGDYPSALIYYQRALEVKQANLEENDPRLADLLSNIGSLHYQQDDLYKTLTYYSRARDIYEAGAAPNPLKLGQIYNNLGSVYKDLDSLENALHYYDKSIKLKTEVYGETHNSLAPVYNNIALVLERKGDFRGALDQLDNALIINKRELGAGHYDLSRNYINIARQHKFLGEYGRALEQIQRAMDIRLQHVEPTHFEIAVTHHQEGRIYQAAGQLDSAIACYYRGLEILGCENPDQFEPEEIAHPFNALLILVDIASTFHLRYYENRNTGNIHLSNKYLDVHLALMEHVILHLDEEQSQRLLRERTYAAFSLGIENSYLLYQRSNDGSHLETAFARAEKSRSLLLIHSLGLENQETVHGIPDSIRSKEAMYKAEISALQNQLDGNSVSRDSLNSVLFEKRKKYYAFLDQMKVTYPQYFSLRYEMAPITTTAIGEKLDTGCSFIEYFLGDTTLFCFAMFGDERTVFRTPVDSTFRQNIERLISATTERDFDTGQFDKTSEQVYAVVFAEVDKWLAGRSDRIIISADGVLNLLPFEMLQNNNGFLIEQYAVSYTHSGYFTVHNAFQENHPRQSFIGFAPDYQAITENEVQGAQDLPVALLVREGNVHLPGAQREMKQIAEMFNKKKFIGDAATKANFLRYAADARIIHLAMHALTNHKTPAFSRLLFDPGSEVISDGFLHAYELYGLRLHADMVVLSACSTGYGKIERGEGVNSISRAFNYAGVPSTVMSLWNVPDQSTGEIMVHFYEGLKNGDKKDVALRNAKLAYLRGAREKELLHPYFWAGFVVHGDIAPLAMSKAWSTKWLFGLLLIIPMYFMIRQTHRNRH